MSLTGSDIYELFCLAQDLGTLVLVRVQSGLLPVLWTPRLGVS